MAATDSVRYTTSPGNPSGPDCNGDRYGQPVLTIVVVTYLSGVIWSRAATVRPMGSIGAVSIPLSQLHAR
jgi:hypothetical protein